MPERPASEQTEPATPRKREQARRKGQVAKSQDLSAAIAFAAALLMFYLAGGSAVTELHRVFQFHFVIACSTQLTPSTMGAFLMNVLIPMARIILPFMFMALVTGVLTNVLQTGVVVSAESMALDLTKLNPFQGWKKFFSLKSFVELIKSIVKLVVVGSIAYRTIRAAIPQLVLLSTSDPGPIAREILLLCFRLGLRAALAMILLAILDYAFQKWQFERSIMMTRQEIRDELRELEGDPQIRSRVRSIRRQMALQRMMAEVPRADVVITNPFHIAVALRYDMSKMAAPTLIAKGARLVAERIKQIAAEKGVPIVEKKTLAQLLYKSVEVGQQIPENLYQVVAEVLAYVYQIDRRAEKARERRMAAA